MCGCLSSVGVQGPLRWSLVCIGEEIEDYVCIPVHECQTEESSNKYTPCTLYCTPIIKRGQILNQITGTSVYAYMIILYYLLLSLYIMLISCVRLLSIRFEVRLILLMVQMYMNAVTLFSLTQYV